MIIECFYLEVVFKSIVKNLKFFAEPEKRDLGGLKYWRFARNTLSEIKIQNLHP